MIVEWVLPKISQSLFRMNKIQQFTYCVDSKQNFASIFWRLANRTESACIINSVVIYLKSIEVFIWAIAISHLFSNYYNFMHLNLYISKSTIFYFKEIIP